MIDLSYLTEEEQEMIMTVLKRDAELKKLEEDRIKHLQTLDPEEGRKKYMTGEWFYEAKSQRHQDRIHGSDIIMASMKQKKPMTVDFLTQSWRERSSKSYNDALTSRPETSNNPKSGTVEQDRLNLAMRSPSRPRHNPFNTIPKNLDLEEVKLSNGAAGPVAQKSSLRAEMLPSLKSHEAKEMDVKVEVSDTLRAIAPRQKPVPKKRTKLYKLQSSVSDSNSSVSTQSMSTTSGISSPVSTQSVSTSSNISSPMSTLSATTSESMSTVSTQSKSANSGIRSPPPRGILKQTSSCSSSDSNIKSQLPQPLNLCSPVSTDITLEQAFEGQPMTKERRECPLSSIEKETQSSSLPLKSALPKSRLPVRSPVSLNTSEPKAQERPKIQPRLSRSSNTRSEDEHKTADILNTVEQKHENNRTLNLMSYAEPENTNIAEGIKEEPRSISRLTTSTALEALLDSSLNKSSLPQIPLHKLKEEDSKLDKNENVKAQEPKDHLHNIVGQHNYEASSRAKPTYSGEASHSLYSSQIADAYLEHESSNRPTKLNMTSKPQKPKEDHKHPIMADSHALNPSEEQGDSIAKVLEWFSRSSDSSDKLDTEVNVQDIENDSKVEDIDFEDEINLRTKPEDNVYLIIPRQSNTANTPKVNDVFLNEREWGEELSVDEPESKPKRGGPPPVTVFSTYPSFQENVIFKKMDISEKAGSKDKVDEMLSNKGESNNADKLDGPDTKLTHHQLDIMDLEDSQPQKIANLKSFWERGNTGPKILVSKTNKPLNQENVCRKVKEYVEESPDSELSLKADSAIPETKKEANVMEILNVHESRNIVRTDPNDSFTNQKKDSLILNSPSDTDVNSLLKLKSSSPSVESKPFLEDKSNENVSRTTSNKSSEEHCMVLELDSKARTEEKEIQAKPGSPPKSSIHIQQPITLAKQSVQQQDNRAERIKQLKSFWEKEKWEPRIYVRSAAANDPKSSMTNPGKLNKRFTKSEFDLRCIGAELDDDLDDNIPSARGRHSPNFSVLPLRDKSVTAEGINSSQFKTLRDFWAGSTAKHSLFESKSQRPLSPEVYLKADSHKEITQHSPEDASLYLNLSLHPNQSEKTNFTEFINESGNTKLQKMGRAPQSSLKEKTATTKPDSDAKGKPPGEQELLRSSYSTQPRRGSQSSQKDAVPPKSPDMLNKESRHQARRSSKGTLNGKGNSLRRAISMFSVNVDAEDEGQATNVPQLRKGTEMSMPQYRKTPEANLQIKKSPDTTKNKEKMSDRRPSRTSEDPDSQPLARSFVPRDYQHYLGITEKRGMFTPPQVTDQMSEIVCTPFQTSPETGQSLRCSPVQASTPLGSAELRARRGSLGPCPSAHHSEGVNRNNLHEVDAWSFSRARSNRDEEGPVQSALRRAATRPVYHKSLEDITAVPRSNRKGSQVDESLPNSCDNSSTPSPPSSSFSDPEHLRNLSKSVPSFLHKENNGGESDSTSEHSSHSGMRWRNGRPRTNFSGNSASLSSVSGSVMSVYSGDFTSVEIQGNIQFSLNYVQKLREFHIFVVQCTNLAAVDPKRNRSDPYVKSYLIPDSSNLGKRKTSVKKRTLNPTFNEILRYRVRMEYLKTQVLNLSVWHNDTFGRNSFLGEIEIDLSQWDFGNTQINSLFLKSRTMSSFQPADERGEMRLAICFLPQLTHSKAVLNSGEVHIWVKECKNLPLIRAATIDPYVKCFVLPDTSKKSRQKTRVLKRSTNPVFNHTMVYDGFRAEDLKDACVELTVWDRDRLANNLLGGLRLGLGTGKSYGVNVDWMDSTAQEVGLWQRMMELPNEWVEDVLPLRILTTAKNPRK